VPSIAIGRAELRLDELTAAYSVFANGGYYLDPYCIVKIEDRDGRLLYQRPSPPDPVPIISDTVASQMIQNLQLVVDSGTAQSLRTVFGLKIALAGKTGTTQRYADGWFVGISPGLVTGVWVGADDPSVHFRTGAGAGSQTALQIYGEFIRTCTSDPAFHPRDMSATFSKYSVTCPLFSDLRANEMTALLEAQKEDDSWFLPNLLESLFAKKDEDSRQFEQRILRQMQQKLDRTATRMRKRKKSPVAISRALEEIRTEYYRRLADEKRRLTEN
jgi:penicillin-binding protein 1A